MEPIKHNSKLWERKQEGGVYFIFWCPACKHSHGISIPRWRFNGNVVDPTFAPSLRLSYVNPETKVEHTTCHLTLTDGKITYHGDCPHELKGQTVPMQDIPANYGF